MGALAKIGADQQRLLQIGQQIFGDRRERIFFALGQICPECGDRLQPDVEQQRVDGEQANRQIGIGAIVGRVGANAPAFGIERQHIERQKDDGQCNIVDQIAQIDNAALDAFKAAIGRKQTQHIAHRFTKKFGEAAVANKVEKATKHYAQNQRHNLVVGARRDKEPDGCVRRRQEQRRQITANHRSPIQITHDRNGYGQEERQSQRDSHQNHDGQEFTQHQLPSAHGERQQNFQRAGLLLFAPLAHGQGRNQKED